MAVVVAFLGCLEVLELRAFRGVPVVRECLRLLVGREGSSCRKSLQPLAVLR